jgi:hypothetical protein
MYGYIDKEGKEIIPPVYEMIGNVQYGVAVYFMNGKQG